MLFHFPILTHKPGLRYTVGTMSYQLQPPTPGLTQCLNQSFLSVTQAVSKPIPSATAATSLVLDSMSVHPRLLSQNPDNLYREPFNWRWPAPTQTVPFVGSSRRRILDYYDGFDTGAFCN